MLKRKPRSTSWIVATYIGLTVIFLIGLCFGFGVVDEMIFLILPFFLLLAPIVSFTLIALTSIIENPKECIKRSSIAFVIIMLVAILITYLIDIYRIGSFIFFASFLLFIFIAITKWLFSGIEDINDFQEEESEIIVLDSYKGRKSELSWVKKFIHDIKNMTIREILIVVVIILIVWLRLV